MSNAKIAALSEGIRYQEIVFWIKAFEMLLPNTDIVGVSYEREECEPCDDVVVFYDKHILEDDSTDYYCVDYIQCKFKVSNEKAMSMLDSIDPNYFGNKKSFLMRAYEFYQKQDNKNIRLILYTTVLPNSNDAAFSKCISGVSGKLNIEKLSTSYLDAVDKHLNIDREKTIDFLSHVRFLFGETVEKTKESLNRICKSVGINYDREKDTDNIEGIIRKLNLTKQTDLDKNKVRTICISNKLFVKQNNQIGLLSFKKEDPRIKEILSYGSRTLDLSSYFNDRKIKEEYSWENIAEDIKKFINKEINFNENYMVNISAIYSVCFAFGKLLGLKIGNFSFINKAGIFNHELREKVMENDSIETIDEEQININKDEVVLAFSFSGNIEGDVYSYVREKGLIDYYIFNKYYDVQNITNNLFWDGILSFCSSSLQMIKRIKPKNIHLFYRGPAEGMFVIGQHAKEWGECTVYEFNFGATPREQKYYKGITI